MERNAVFQSIFHEQEYVTAWKEGHAIVLHYKLYNRHGDRSWIETEVWCLLAVAGLPVWTKQQNRDCKEAANSGGTRERDRRIAHCVIRTNAKVSSLPRMGNRKTRPWELLQIHVWNMRWKSIFLRGREAVASEYHNK